MLRSIANIGNEGVEFGKVVVDNSSTDDSLSGLED